MFDSDDEPKKRPLFQLGQNLSDLSVDDLNEIVQELEDEILRLKEDAAAKQASKTAADAFFKS